MRQRKDHQPRSAYERAPDKTTEERSLHLLPFNHQKHPVTLDDGVVP